MSHASRARLVFVFAQLSLAVGAVSCSSMPTFSGFSSKKDDGLSRVDELLARVERVQVESVLAKERSDQALGVLEELVAPEFDDDPVAAYGRLTKAIEDSKAQAKSLSETVAPMKELANDVFADWTASLESFANKRMRAASQTRLEETRSRYEEIVQRAVAAQISYDSFNADLHDHALFLEHDFNVQSVELLRGELDGLGSDADELGGRLDACIAATQAYVEGAALRGQLAQSATQTRQRPRAEEQPQAQSPATPKRRARTLPPPEPGTEVARSTPKQ